MTWKASDPSAYNYALDTDPRPWWFDMPPRKRVRYKNVTLTSIARLRKWQDPKYFRWVP